MIDESMDDHEEGFVRSILCMSRDLEKDRCFFSLSICLPDSFDCIQPAGKVVVRKNKIPRIRSVTRYELSSSFNVSLLFHGNN